MKEDPSEWRFPLPCPACADKSGVPCRVAEEKAGRVGIWIRCARCAHEWELEGDLPPLMMKPKSDRRQAE
jgi:hypothetical protein